MRYRQCTTGVNPFGKHCKVSPSRTKETIALCTVYRSKAQKALLSGLRLDATDADLWFVLGVLAPHKALKQHAFIQALRVDAYHAATWAHLGQVWRLFLLLTSVLLVRFSDFEQVWKEWSCGKFACPYAWLLCWLATDTVTSKSALSSRKGPRVGKAGLWQSSECRSYFEPFLGWHGICTWPQWHVSILLKRHIVCPWYRDETDVCIMHFFLCSCGIMDIFMGVINDWSCWMLYFAERRRWERHLLVACMLLIYHLWVFYSCIIICLWLWWEFKSRWIDALTICCLTVSPLGAMIKFTRSRAYAHSVPLDSGPFEQNVHVQLGLAKLAERTHQLHLAQVLEMFLVLGYQMLLCQSSSFSGVDRIDAVKSVQ